jgi:PPOX class probable F420-dependent enzyme
MKARNLATLYDQPIMEWGAISRRLDAGYGQAPGSGGPDRHTSWLATIDPDGSPHVTGVGTVWADGALWFETGDGTRKARNLARDPRCTVSVALREFDLVVDGQAEKVVDPATVARMAARWAAGGWPCRVDETGMALTANYSAQSAGPPPWYVYRLTLRRATAIETVEPGRATRWTFSSSAREL